MNEEFERGDPDTFDLAWLDDEELHKLQNVMLSYRENDICFYWLYCLKDQVAISRWQTSHSSGAEARDPDSRNIRSGIFMQPE